MKHICKTAGLLTNDLSSAIDKVGEAYEICARCREPTLSRKVSLTHFNAAVNQEIEVDLTRSDIAGKRHDVLNVADKETGWIEMCSIADKTMATTNSCIKRLRICMHGALRSISGDDAFHKPAFHRLMEQRNITFKPKPERRNNKLGHVDRRNRTIKTIIKRLDKCSAKRCFIVICYIWYLINFSVTCSWAKEKGYCIVTMPSEIVHYADWCDGERTV